MRRLLEVGCSSELQLEKVLGHATFISRSEKAALSCAGITTIRFVFMALFTGNLKCGGVVWTGLAHSARPLIALGLRAVSCRFNLGPGSCY